ncbi:MAG: hypothetical protein ACRDHP_14820, partial [Ktedonobacterales bacterium]
MSGEPTLPERRARMESPALSSPRFLELGAGTLAYSAAGWLDLLAGTNGNAVVALGIVALLIGGTILLVRAVALPPGDPSHPERPARRMARRAILAGLALSALITLAFVVSLAASAGDTGIYDSDAAAFNHYNAELVLRGRNPYTADASFWDALAQFPAAGATPLHAGRYAESVLGPSLRQVVADVQYERAHPSARGPEYAPASLHSYPALALLVYVPGVWAGLPTTFYTSLLVLLMFFLAAGWGASHRSRPAFWLLLAASPLLAFWTLRGSFEVVALLPALLAWRLMERTPAFSSSTLVRPSLQSKLRTGSARSVSPAETVSGERTRRSLRFGGNPGWLSPVLLGLACAVKQLIWPLVPLYVLLIWKREGTRAALVRLGVALLAFLAPNVPFLLASPDA